MQLQIGKFRGGMWVALVTLAILVPTSGGLAAWQLLWPGVAAGLAAVLGIYTVGCQVHLRTGVIAAALLAGNFAFLQAARSGAALPELAALAVQCWLMLAVARLRRRRWWLPALLGFLAVSLAAYALPASNRFTVWPGVITTAIGGLGAVLFLLKRRSAEAPLWYAALAWGVFNLACFHDKLLASLPAAALLGAWLIDNCDHRRIVRSAGGGVLIALRLMPFLILGVWALAWWGFRESEIRVPLRVPLITLAVLCVCNFGVTRFFKFADRRVVIVLTASLSIAVAQLMLVEPLREQELQRARRETAVETVPVLEAAPAADGYDAVLLPAE